MAKQIKKRFKYILIILGVGLIFGLKWLFVDSEMLFKKDVKQTVDIAAVMLPDAPKDAQGSAAKFIPLPTSEIASVQSPKITFKIMAWNSQMGLNYANGGPHTTKGSIMEQHHVNLNIERQDDCNQMATELIAFAQNYKNNPSTAVGTNFIAIMGDGAPAWLSGVNNELKKLGDEYTAKIVFSCGKSQGEDQFMASPSVKADPQAARGICIATVLKDGDWNIVIKFASDNAIPVNTDEKTYDPEAINFVAANDFIDAGQKYIAGYSEVRAVVKRDEKTGKTIKTGETKTITVNAVSSWSPVDVQICEQKGGLVTIVSTSDYKSQMPNVIIGINKYMQDNRKSVENMIKAITEAGDQVKSYDEALTKASDISATIYKEKEGIFWKKLYKGYIQSDIQGNVVNLGGSRVHNLSDNLELFGIGESKTNVYASVYKVFGDIVSSLYPEYVKTYPPIESVLDLSYLLHVKNESSNLVSADKIAYNNTGSLSQTVSKRAWSIEFETSSANFSPKAISALEELYNQLNVASGLQIEIFGFTDNTGNPDANLLLSDARANAVKNWLQGKSDANYPNSRFAQVKGKGESEPIADNNTYAGKAKNRRCEIVLGR